MQINNQRKMTFLEKIDAPEAGGEHKFYFSISKDYLKGKKILDVGSWTGSYETLIYDLAKDITCVDIEEKALNVLKKKLPKVKTRVAKSDNLPFKDETFDIVCFFDVIEHIPPGYELAALKEINRVLKKNGYLFISTMNSNFWSNLLDPAYFLAGHRHYSRKHLKGLLLDSMFEPEKVYITGSFLTSFYAIAFYFFKHILRMNMPRIDMIERKVEKDFKSSGFTQISIRARKLKA